MKATILLSAIILQTPAFAQERCSPDVQEPARTAIAKTIATCVEREAPILERSRERAETVAIAVINKCGPSFDAMRQGDQDCLGFTRAQRIDAELKRRYREKVIEKIVAIRARRHS